MKPYLLFAYEHYEPAGGVGDYVADFDSHEDAGRAGQALCDRAIHGFRALDHWDVVERLTMRVVASDRLEQLSCCP